MRGRKKKKDDMKEEETVHTDNKQTELSEEEKTEQMKEKQDVKIETPKSETELLEERCIALEKEKNEALNKNLRLLAEFENYRRRNEKERVDWIKNANEKLSLKICDILDDFERALQVEPTDKQFEQFLKGVESIFKKLEKVLNGEGVEKVESLGEEFNPMYHEAVSYIPSEEKADTVISVLQNGYLMGNKVVRAAKVVVSSGKG